MSNFTDHEIRKRVHAAIRPQLRHAISLAKAYRLEAWTIKQEYDPDPHPAEALGRTFGTISKALNDSVDAFTNGMRQALNTNTTYTTGA